jgi:16S rRNA (adenine1518-N6/adenine1519-N6)-dimethyltransferase
MQKKKSLGQHFLHSAHYLRLIADAADITKGETILEVGPGEGALTRELLARGARVVAVEKDRRLLPVLRKSFAKEIAEQHLMLAEADILHFDISKCGLRAGEYKLVANIPYYITGALLKKFLSGGAQPRAMVLLVQKEVAGRIVGRKSAQGRPASGGKESVLSLSVKVYGAPRYLKTVPRGAFNPPPKVDSAILQVADISRGRFASAAQERKFFELVKRGFSAKRKLLVNNLGKEYSDLLKNLGVSPNARAEDLPLEAWLALSRPGGPA